jgi:hypothetical protein
MEADESHDDRTGSFVDLTSPRLQFVRLSTLLATFAVGMAYFEAAVVVYLRELYYPEGFAFPLKLIPKTILFIEVGRELAALVMLASIAIIVVRRRWERFGWFLFMFGIWDVWYYIWLKVTLDWPSSLFDWDVLFLIPLPWSSPVIAPLLIAATMIVIGPWIVLKSDSRDSYRPGMRAWVLGLLGSASILYSFMSDTGAILNQELPQSYSYWLLVLGLGCYWSGFLLSIRPTSQKTRSGHG